ncbi:DNRLRE domain-containing protein [Aquimonas sp.]|jgi:hypothetical protein|uniref:DNRLRE domain-containing protein n=1 Tax=Aquimonas sp. TaxID=1872588 RepID=UPI0037BF74BE
MNRSIALAALLAAGTSAVWAAPSQVRVTWDGPPDREAVIGFSTSETSGGYIRFGSSSTRSSWARANTQSIRSFGNLRNHFVRLENLPANTPIYFEACDSTGCGPAHWFLTAPSAASALTFITGGDSRTNRSLRQQGNRLVAKIRPLFVMFGGDYTQGNTTTEMSEWLSDWELAYPQDTVDGLSVRHAIPLLPTVGNHEDNDQTMLCKLFGVDADRDGACSLRDTHYAVSIGGDFIRAYTLNTQLRLSGYSSQWQTQNTWLNTDLAGAGSARWRIAQYHVPMFPRTSSKPSFNSPVFQWAQPFYQYAMNLVEESDSHLVKYTFPVRPEGSGLREAAAGTVYAGEGAWGAPTRTADRQNDWILGQASFAHLRVISATADRLELRTVHFAGEGDTAALSRSARLSSPLALPSGLSLWADTPIGPVYGIARDGAGRSRLADGQLPETRVLGAAADAHVRSSGARTNGTVLLADGSDSGSELRALMRWDLTQVPATLAIQSVSVQLNVSDRSAGQYDLYRANASWSESSLSWSQATNLGERIGSIVPNTTGTQSVQLNAAGLTLVRDWISGARANHGVVLVSAGTGDGVDFSSREGAVSPKLVIAHTP